MHTEAASGSLPEPPWEKYVEKAQIATAQYYDRRGRGGTMPDAWRAVLAAVYERMRDDIGEEIAQKIEEHDRTAGNMHPDDAFGDGLRTAASIARGWTSGSQS